MESSSINATVFVNGNLHDQQEVVTSGPTGNPLASLLVLTGEHPQLFLTVVVFGVLVGLMTYFVVRSMLDPSHLELQHHPISSSDDDLKVLEEKKRSRMDRLLSKLEGCMKVVTANEMPEQHDDDSDTLNIDKEDQMITVSLSTGDETESHDSRDVSTLCSVCLVPYEANDTIVWSPNPSCQHIFHKECILEWLGREKERCPCCRHYFIQEESDEEQRQESSVSTEEGPNVDNESLEDDVQVALV